MFLHLVCFETTELLFFQNSSLYGNPYPQERKENFTITCFNLSKFAYLDILARKLLSKR